MLPNYEALQCCVQTVRREYLAYIRHLDICTKSTLDAPPSPPKADAQIITQLMMDLLPQCPKLEQLTLRLHASLDKDVIPSFQNLTSLKVLTISNCGDEQNYPLYVFDNLIADIQSC